MRRISVLFTLVVSSLYYSAEADSGVGGCPDIPTVSNFDVNRFVGVWYEIENYPTFFEKGEKCIRYNYSLAEDASGDAPPLKLTYTRVKTDTGDVQVNHGDAVFSDMNRGKLRVRFASLDPRDDYWVLATDYDSYLVASSCHGLGSIFHLQSLWIYAREKSLPETLLAQLRTQIDGLGLDSSKLIKADQSC